MTHFTLFMSNFEDTLYLAFLPIQISKCLLLTSYLPGSVLGAEDMKIIKISFLSQRVFKLAEVTGLHTPATNQYVYN